MLNGLFYVTRSHAKVPVERHKRADRRAHMERLKTRARRIVKSQGFEPDASGARVGKLASTHGRPCSCMLCKRGAERIARKVPAMPHHSEWYDEPFTFSDLAWMAHEASHYRAKRMHDAKMDLQLERVSCATNMDAWNRAVDELLEIEMQSSPWLTRMLANLAMFEDQINEITGVSDEMIYSEIQRVVGFGDGRRVHPIRHSEFYAH